MNKILLWTFVLFTSFSFSQKRAKKKTLPEQIKQAGIFDNFKVLAVPRDNISIGAEWIEDFGPSSNGLESADLFEAQSLAKYNFQIDNDFNIGLKINIASLLGLTTNYEVLKFYNLEIDSASIVRVSNIDKLNYSAGSTFIWEGIKLKSISLTISNDKIDTVKLNLYKINKVIDIMPEQYLNNLRRVVIRGLNLFAAYRLVKFENVETYNTNDISLEVKPRTVSFGGLSTTVYDLTGFKLGSNYVGNFFKVENYITSNFNNKMEYEEEQKNAQIWPTLNKSENCSIVMTVECNNQLVNKSPRLLKFKICNSMDYFKVILSSKIIGNEFVIDELQIKGLVIMWDYLPSYYEDRTFFIHKKIKIPIKTFTNNNVPGW